MSGKADTEGFHADLSDCFISFFLKENVRYPVGIRFSLILGPR